MVSRVKAAGIEGVNGYLIDVEVDVSQGLPSFDIVGLPDAAVRESRERVRASIKNCGFDFPARRITVNMAPADKKKEGPLYDLPIFVAILAATEQLRADLRDYAFIGELSLSGEIRPVRGVLPVVLALRDSGATVTAASSLYSCPAKTRRRRALPAGLKYCRLSTSHR